VYFHVNKSMKPPKHHREENVGSEKGWVRGWGVSENEQKIGNHGRLPCEWMKLPNDIMEKIMRKVKSKEWGYEDEHKLGHHGDLLAFRWINESGSRVNSSRSRPI
jgi:hypothetical protein